MDWLDNEIDKWQCSKFAPDPVFMNEILSQTDSKIKNAYALDVDCEVDTNVIKEFTKCFYDLGIT